jgi:hypothetical protein
MQLTKKAQESLERVIERFKSGDLSPIVKVARTRLSATAPSQRWSLCNRVLAYAQTDEFDCRGFKQWQQVGRTIKKGERAAYIFRPHVTKLHFDQVHADESTVICTGFSTVAVFAASSTVGETQLIEYAPTKLPPLIKAAEKLGVDVSFIPALPGRLGDCTTDGTRIRLGSKEPRVFFHELAHAIHAKIGAPLKSGQHTDQETIAEFTATVLMDLYNLGDHSGNAWHYIAHYADEPMLAIMRALSTVEKVLEVLLQTEAQQEKAC